MRPAISIIVPVYRSENYLSRCIDSLLAQTFPNFEIILIDDGSPDNSGAICHKYALNEKRIRLYQKKNEGISATRQFGIEHALGEYIQFVDSDDWIESDMLTIMYEIARQTGSEIVGCNFVEEHLNESVYWNTCYTTKEDFIRAVIRSDWGVVWKILIKRELFEQNNIHFPKNINGGEDYFVCTKLLYYAQKVICTNHYLYHYIRYNPNSIMSSASLIKIQDQINATKNVELFLQEKNIESQYKQELTQRKLISKYDLLQINGLLWLQTFPETHKVWQEIPMSKSRKLIHYLAEKKMFSLIRLLFYVKNKIFYCR